MIMCHYEPMELGEEYEITKLDKHGKPYIFFAYCWGRTVEGIYFLRPRDRREAGIDVSFDRKGKTIAPSCIVSLKKVVKP